jgi:hypothetical protein
LDKKYNILICPLEWGLGHAARMIPIARRLRELNHNVIIASGDEHLELFRNEIPDLSCISFPGFKPGYSRHFPQYLHLLFKIPQLLWQIFSEHHRIKKIISDNSIDILISDNRFGLWNSNLTTVYVTHQTLIPLPHLLRFLEPVGVALHRQIIKKYSFCYIPDLPGEMNLSGRLSHGFKQTANTRYVGILSRFSESEDNLKRNTLRSDYNTIILSGPEPQRGILREKLLYLLKSIDTPAIVFEGKPEKSGETTGMGNITFYGHLPGRRMRDLIEGSRNIITRSGYTTVMELVSLKRSALLIPTPGQTEQEYLAEYLSEKGWFKSVSQSEIDDIRSLDIEEADFPDEINQQSRILLDAALKELLEEQHKKCQSDGSGK